VTPPDPPPRPVRLVVAAPPAAPGVAALLDRAVAEAARGADVRVLFTGDALAARWDGLLPADVPASACARSARDRGLPVPPGVLPSSLVGFLRDAEGARLWTAFG
jgi:hypothetical protein